MALERPFRYVNNAESREELNVPSDGAAVPF
jgi:hypothetical protein